MKKPRGDSFLKTLPPAVRDQVWEWLQVSTHEKTRALIRDHLAEHVVAWEQENERTLALAGSSFTEFTDWYPVTMALREAATLTDQLKAQLAENPEINLDDDQLARAGQLLFEGIAISKRDSKLFVALKRLRQDAAALGIEEKKLRQKVREYEDKLRAAQAMITQAKAAGGITPETLQTIEEKLRLL